MRLFSLEKEESWKKSLQVGKLNFSFDWVHFFISLKTLEELNWKVFRFAADENNFLKSFRKVIRLWKLHSRKKRVYIDSISAASKLLIIGVNPSGDWAMNDIYFCFTPFVLFQLFIRKVIIFGTDCLMEGVESGWIHKFRARAVLN